MTVPREFTLEGMAEIIEEARREVERRTAEFNALKPAYNAAAGRLADARDDFLRKQKGLAMAKLTHATQRALAEAEIDYPHDVVKVKVRDSFRSRSIGDAFFLVAVASDGQGLYKYTPPLDERYKNTTFAVLGEHELPEGMPDWGRRDVPEGMTPHWDRSVDQWGKRGYGSAGSIKPLPPTGGGRWKWLKLKKQADLPKADLPPITKDML